MTRWSRMFDGRAEAVGEARRFAQRLLGGHELAEVAALVVDELATNAIRHTNSGGDGGFFVVELEAFSDHATVSVIDMGSASEPALAPLDPAESDAEGGRGLHIVEAVSKQWGSELVRVGRRVWADLADGS